MSKSVVLFIFLRYIRGNSINQFGQFVYWFSTITTTFGITILILILSIINGFEKNIKNSFLFFTSHISLLSSDKCVDFDEIPNFVIDNKERFIIHVQPLILSNIILQTSKKMLPGIMFGINPNYFEPISTYLIYGHIRQLIPGKYRIFISLLLAKQLNVNINDTIRLVIPNLINKTPIGIFPSQRIFVVSGIYVTNSDIDTYQVIVNQEDAARLMHYSCNCITGWRLWIKNPFMLNDYYNYNRSKLSSKLIWTDWRDIYGSLFQAIKMEKNMILLLLTLIIIISGSNIFSFLILLIFEKAKEITILRTCGFTRFQTTLFVVLYTVTSHLLGILLGTSLGIIVSKKINEILFFFRLFLDIPIFPVEIQFQQIFFIILLIFIIVVIFSIILSWKTFSIFSIKRLNHV